MPGQKRLAGALAAVAVAMAISACGSSSSDQTIDQADSSRLIGQLNAVQAAVDSRKCNQAQQLAQAFVDTVNELPDTVGTANKNGLREAGQHLEDLASEPNQCQQVSTGPSGLTGTQSSTTTTTSSIPTTTETTTSTTSTTSEPAPPSNGGGNEGNGGGAPPSNGGGGGSTGDGGGGVGGGAGGTGGTGTGGTGGGGTG